MLKFTAYGIEDTALSRIVNSNSDVKLYIGAYKEIAELFTKDEFCKRVVGEIDKSEILSEYAISSPYIGVRGIEFLSGGISTILDIYFRIKLNEYGIDSRRFYFESAHIDDYCISYLFELASKYDIIMRVTSFLKITDNIFNQFPQILYSLDEDRYITSVDDYEDTSLKHYTEYIEKCEAEWKKELYGDEDEVFMRKGEEELQRFVENQGYKNISDYFDSLERNANNV